MDSIGSRLRSLRSSQGLSLKQLAERVGCTPSYLSMVENDKLDPSASRLKKIADALGSTIIELFSEQSNGAEVVLRKEERQRVAVRGSKLLIEILVRQAPGKQIDARLAVVAPGGGSEGDYEGKCDLGGTGLAYDFLELAVEHADVLGEDSHCKIGYDDGCYEGGDDR